MSSEICAEAERNRWADRILATPLLYPIGKIIDRNTHEVVRHALLQIFCHDRFPVEKTAQMIALLLRAGIEGVFLTEEDMKKQLQDTGLSSVEKYVKKWLPSDKSWILEKRPKHSSRIVLMDEGFENSVDVFDDPGYRIVRGPRV